LIAITATLNPAPVARTEAAVKAARALVVRYHEDASATELTIFWRARSRRIDRGSGPWCGFQLAGEVVI